MSNQLSKLWLLGPPVAIGVAAFAYYAKFPAVRTWVDTRVPWVKENVGSRLPPLVENAEAPATAPDSNSPVNSSPAPMWELPSSSPPPPSAVSAGPGFVDANGAVDLTRLAATRGAWPKSVRLKTKREFPAVLNGRRVGTIAAPAGSEANLVSIQAGKLGVEFQGGGAWVDPAETDLAARLRGVMQ